MTQEENLTEIKPELPEIPADGWVLSAEEEELVLATARYNKIKHKEWLAKQGRWLPTDDFDSLTLTEDEAQDALIKANKMKVNEIWFDNIRLQNRQKAKLQQEALLAQWNYAKFYREMQERCLEIEHKHLIFNEFTGPLIKTVCFKLSGDARYVTEIGLNTRKSLIIRGPYGVGKSFTFKLVAENPINPVQIITMNEIVRSVRKTGDFTGVRFNKYSFVLIDDVGTEYDRTDKVKSYGSDINWFKEWYEELYANSHDQMHRLIMTTNDDFETLGLKYGDRVRDRMAECDVLDVYGESMRRM